MKPLEILSDLEELGFFKYVLPENHLSSKQRVYEELIASGTIDFFADLNRVFSIDGEDIYETDGILDKFKGMIELFSAMGINLVIGKYVEDFDNNTGKYRERTIEINGKKYDASGTSDWGEAFTNGVELIEEVLQDYKYAEKVFALYWDQCATLILLDKPLFDYLKKIVPEKATYRPMDFERIPGEN